MEKGYYAGMNAVKSAKRTEFIDGVVKIITSKKIYKGLKRSSSEEYFIAKVDGTLVDGLEKLFAKENPDRDKKWIEKKVEDSLIREKDANVTVNNIVFFGTQHRPDMYIRNGNYRIALEYKVVSSGEAIRAALGQCLVYASEFEFTICILLDTTKDGKIRKAFMTGDKEKRLLQELWDTYGAKVIVVEPDM